MRLALLGVIGMCVACGPSAPRTAASPVVGLFRFSDRVPNTSPSVLLEGEVSVEKDTVIVSTMSGICRYNRQSSGGLYIVYDCGDVRLSFDRTDLVRRNGYSLTTTVRRSVRRCARYETASDGRRVCAEMRNELEERQEPRNGRLNLQRVG